MPLEQPLFKANGHNRHEAMRKSTCAVGVRVGVGVSIGKGIGVCVGVEV